MKKPLKVLAYIAGIVAIVILAIAGYTRFIDNERGSNPITETGKPKVKQNEDLQTALNEYPPMVDARTEAFMDYQRREKMWQDAARTLRKVGKSEMADLFVEFGKEDLKRVKKVAQDSPSSNTTINYPVTQNIEGNTETITFSKKQVKPSYLSFKQGDVLTVLALEGRVQVRDLSGAYFDLMNGYKYDVGMEKIESGPFFFYSETPGRLVIKKN